MSGESSDTGMFTAFGFFDLWFSTSCLPTTTSLLGSVEGGARSVACLQLATMLIVVARCFKDFSVVLLTFRKLLY